MAMTFEYSSVHGALAAAYASGMLAAEFGPERVRVSLSVDVESRGWPAPLLAELELAEARRYRYDTRLLGLVPDGDGPAWALLTSHIALERHPDLLARALAAVLLARPHRRPVLDGADATWAAPEPLRAATIMVSDEFVASAAWLTAA